MKYIRMLLGTTGFLMLFLGAHFHFVDQVVCDKASVELTLEFARILKLDQAYDKIRGRLNSDASEAEPAEDGVEGDLGTAAEAVEEETNRYANDWNNRVSEEIEDTESIVEAESEEGGDETITSSKWGGLVQREDVYEWTPPGPLSGFLIAFGLVITVMNIATSAKRSDG